MRVKGKLLRWDDDKGFGFIRPNLTGPEVFLHINSLRNASRRPKEGDVITYALVADKQGRATASNATLTGDKLKGKQGAKRSNRRLPYAVMVSFTLSLLALKLSNYISLLLLLAYLGLSLFTFLIYALDKIAARKNRWRTPESSLHLLSLIGGWPGAILAQQWLRHKSIKQPFRGIFWLTIIINIAALAYAINLGMA
ncbi:cold shock and DUF1294 domain-containing protein [Shewanella sp. SR44-3]|uniref:DUF1294 domain-containing protein n=1 Tax=unclassified Shewanella TaxID=196818 RepID=UPI0015FCDB13|nr:cold shock and DUF1294 domain-containing protein [Shewanella sp. SR44-3]MBB1268702.1 cold shock and DUF1294 domain-containing protein [Shewanella sp. SR44-3]